METVYLKTFFTILLSGLLIIAGFNWFVDPYSLHKNPEIPGFNAIKADFVSFLRLTKAHTITHQKPTSIILGTSRAARGLSPDHRGWDGEQCYNAALPASSIYEALRYFQHANALNPLKQVLLSLELRSFDNVKPGAFSESRMAISAHGDRNRAFIFAYVSDVISTLLSYDALETSLRTIRFQGQLKKSLLDNGRYDRISVQFDHLKAFRLYTVSNYHRLIESRYDKNTTENNIANYDYFRTLLRAAHTNNIDLRLLISPSHAWFWETLRVSGLWPKFENWKRMLVQINDEEAVRAQALPFPIWDFSGYNSLTTEAVPSSSGNRHKMQWFWDPVHFKVKFGDLVLDRVFGYEGADEQVPENFGVLINTQNIESHLKNIQISGEYYQSTHSEDLKNIMSITSNGK
jgi:hypothetical protein